MTVRSHDSASLYSRASLPQDTSTLPSSAASPCSSDIVLGRKSIDARRLSPLSTLYGSSGAWAFDQAVSGSAKSKRLSHSKSMGSANCNSPRVDYYNQDTSKGVKNDGELLGELFSSVNSNLHVTFPSTYHQQDQSQIHQSSLAAGPPRANKFSFSRNLMPFQEEEGITSTPPRKRRADLQSKFSMSPDTRSVTARSAKVIKKKASQARVRKSSTIRESLVPNQVVQETVKQKLKPQSSLQGLRKLVGLTPVSRSSKTSAAPRHGEFPDSLRMVMESQALKEASSVNIGSQGRMSVNLNGIAKKSKMSKKNVEPQVSSYRETKYVIPEIEEKGKLLPDFPRSAQPAEGFWKKIRVSTKPKDSIDQSRSNSRCESRSTRRTIDEIDEMANGKSSRWWNRIRDNAAKMVGQPASLSIPPTVVLQRPSMTVDDDQSRYKGSLDAAMTLADGMERYSSGLPEIDNGTCQSMPDPMQHLGSRQKKRPPVPLLLLQSRIEEEHYKERCHRPFTANPLVSQIASSTSSVPHTAPLGSQLAKERCGSKKTWLRPLQLTAVLRNNNFIPDSNAYDVRQNSKQSDPCLMQRTAAEMEEPCSSSPPRVRLSVPALSSIKYRDTLPIPPRSRRSRASTVSSMDSRTSTSAVKEDQTQRTEYTQRTIGSSILFKDEELLRGGSTLPPQEELPSLPVSQSKQRSSLDSCQSEKDAVTPREATDILYNLVRGFKNDNSPSTFRTTSNVTNTMAATISHHLTPLQPTPDAFRQRRGRRTTCTTLESILSYQSSTDCSSSFVSRTISSTAGDTSKHTQSEHLQSLIDGVLEDIEDLISKSATSSRGRHTIISPAKSKKNGSQSRHSLARSASMSSIGSAHSKFQWPLKEETPCYPPAASQQLRLLGAKLFSSTMEIQPQDSPCPASKKRPITTIVPGLPRANHQQNLSQQGHGHSHFQTDLMVGRACIPPLTKSAFQDMLETRTKSAFVQQHQGSNQKMKEKTGFCFSCQSPSTMQSTCKDNTSSPLPPTIRVQRPLSETSVSTTTHDSPEEPAVIRCAQVVQNRKSSASLMDLNDLLNQCNMKRSRSPSCSSSQYDPLGNDSVMTATSHGAPSTPFSMTSSSQPSTESSLSRLWSAKKRNSYSTAHTEISPVSALEYDKKQISIQTTYQPPPLSSSQEDVADREEMSSNQEALETIRLSQYYNPDSEYARQILSTFTPPKTLRKVIAFLQESQESFQLLKGKMPSLITICVVERERDQKRLKRRSLRHPLQQEVIMNQVAEESSDDDLASQWSEIDDASIFIPNLLNNRWSIDQDQNNKPNFQYIVQSPSTESTSTNYL